MDQTDEQKDYASGNAGGVTATEQRFLTPIPRDPGQSITMSFPDAMTKIIAGEKVRRMSWETQTDHCLLKDGWLTIHTKGAFHNWLINDGDIEGQDWIVIK